MNLFVFFLLLTAGIPGGKFRLIPTRSSIRTRTVIGGKVAKTIRTQNGHSNWSSITTRRRALGYLFVITSFIIVGPLKIYIVDQVNQSNIYHSAKFAFFCPVHIYWSGFKICHDSYRKHTLEIRCPFVTLKKDVILSRQTLRINVCKSDLCLMFKKKKKNKSKL